MNLQKTSVLALAITVVACSSEPTKSVSTESSSTAAAAPVNIEDTKAYYGGNGIGKYTSHHDEVFTEAQAKLGQEIFDSKCLACHELSDAKKVGPGLAGISTRRTQAWILNMITNPVEMTKSDPLAHKLLAETLSQMTFQDVDDAQAKALVAFLTANDNSPKP